MQTSIHEMRIETRGSRLSGYVSSLCQSVETIMGWHEPQSQLDRNQEPCDFENDSTPASAVAFARKGAFRLGAGHGAWVLDLDQKSLHARVCC